MGFSPFWPNHVTFPSFLPLPLLVLSTVFSSQRAHNFDFQKFVRHFLRSSLFPRIQPGCVFAMALQLRNLQKIGKKINFHQDAFLQWHCNYATCKKIEKNKFSPGCGFAMALQLRNLQKIQKNNFSPKLPFSFLEIKIMSSDAYRFEVAFQFCNHQDAVLQWHCNYATCKKFEKIISHQNCLLVFWKSKL